TTSGRCRLARLSLESLGSRGKCLQRRGGVEKRHRAGAREWEDADAQRLDLEPPIACRQERLDCDVEPQDFSLIAGMCGDGEEEDDGENQRPAHDAIERAVSDGFQVVPRICRRMRVEL